MKKIILLILISFSCLFILDIDKAQAQAVGRCLDKEKKVLPNITKEEDCVRVQGTWEVEGGGICTDKDGKLLENIKYRSSCTENVGYWTPDYNYLAPFGTDPENQSFNPAEENALSKYVNFMIKIAIGIAAVLAVIMIVMGGIQYMTSELISSKEEGKKRITNAVFGLLIALGSYLILFTINPNLLDLEPDGLEKASLTFYVEPEVNNYTPQEATGIITGYTGSSTQPGVTSVPDNSPGVLSIIGVAWGVPRNLVANHVAPIIERSGLRTVKAIIMHGTAGGGDNNTVLATFISKRGASGAHFSIDRNGNIWQLARINKYTNHFIADGRVPGISNSNTIGIELVQKYICTKGTYQKCQAGHWEALTSAQVSSSRILLNKLVSVFNLQRNTSGSWPIYGHGEVGKDRTPDEGLEAIKKAGYR